MGDRKRFLEKVGAALQSPTSHGRGALAYADLPAPPERQPPADLLALLTENAAALNIQLHLVEDPAGAGAALKNIVGTTEAEWDHQRAVMAWDTPLLKEIGVEEIVAGGGMDFHWAPGGQEGIDAAGREHFFRRLGEARIGVTGADLCVADTATLVLRNRPGEPMAVSLVPSVHVAVIREAQLLPDFIALYERLAEERAADPGALTARMTFISGPSKTGDIELVMVHGAHGPRALHLVVIRER